MASWTGPYTAWDILQIMYLEFRKYKNIKIHRGEILLKCFLIIIFIPIKQSMVSVSLSLPLLMPLKFVLSFNFIFLIR